MEDTADTTESGGESRVEAPRTHTRSIADPSQAHTRNRAAHRRRRPLRLLLIGLAAFFALALIADAVSTGGRVHARVSAGGINLSGETLSQAEDALGAEATRMQGLEIAYHRGEQTLSATPAALGWHPDPGATAAAAHAVGRGGPGRWVFGRLGAWLFGKDIPWIAQWDRQALRTVIAGWSDVVGLPIQEGSVRIEKGEVVATEPKAGTKIDVDSLMARTEQALDQGTTDLELPVLQAGPISTTAAVEVAEEQAQTIISAPIRVGIGRTSIVLSPNELGDLYVTTVNENELAIPQPVASFDPERVDALLEPYKEAVEKPAVNATPITSGNRIIGYTPSRNGRAIDPTVAATALFKISTSSSRSGRIPLVVVEPSRTTEAAKALGITTRISTFTTYHPSGEARIANIHLGAEVIRGTVIEPGKSFSLNDALGERTEAKGYVLAPAIFDGLIVEQVGGGISQLATTLYNAAFFAGFPIDEHQAHSFWFTRYPMGREATLGWKTPDLVFTNDLDARVLIDTSYTETSITVSIYGTEVTRKVSASPPDITEKDKEYYTVAVTREIEDLDGKVLDREVFLTRYRKELEPTPTPTPSPSE